MYPEPTLNLLVPTTDFYLVILDIAIICAFDAGHPIDEPYFCADVRGGGRENVQSRRCQVPSPLLLVFAS